MLAVSRHYWFISNPNNEDSDRSACASVQSDHGAFVVVPC